MSYCRCRIPVVTTTSSSTIPNPHLSLLKCFLCFLLAGFFCFPPAHYPRLLPPPPLPPSPQQRLELIVQLLNLLLKRNAGNRSSNRFLTTVFHFASSLALTAFSINLSPYISIRFLLNFSHHCSSSAFAHADTPISNLINKIIPKVFYIAHN